MRCCYSGWATSTRPLPKMPSKQLPYWVSHSPSGKTGRRLTWSWQVSRITHWIPTCPSLSEPACGWLSATSSKTRSLPKHWSNAVLPSLLPPVYRPMIMCWLWEKTTFCVPYISTKIRWAYRFSTYPQANFI